MFWTDLDLFQWSIHFDQGLDIFYLINYLMEGTVELPDLKL